MPFCVISRRFLNRDPGIPAENLEISYNIFLYPLLYHFSQKNCFRHAKRSKIHLAPDYQPSLPRIDADRTYKRKAFTSFIFFFTKY